MTTATKPLNPPQRLLLGPGPSPVDPRVLQALSAPVLGHLDPAFLGIMNDTMELLRRLFGTQNQLTIPVSGTGSAGMESTFVNLIEPGDRVVVGVNGLFGERMADVAARCGAQVVAVQSEWGRPIDPEAAGRALQGGKTKLVAVVHAETSTGVLQPLEEIARLAKQHGALLLADCVTSLGGVAVEADRTGIDAAYSGTQKCLSCPPGLAPVTFSEAARAVLKNRKTKVQSWYLDLSMIEAYWGQDRLYHHTAPISMVYGLYEAARIAVEEGLEARFARHRHVAGALTAGLRAMGLELLAEEKYRLPTLTSIKIPAGVEDLPVRRALLQQYDIEIGGGLGPLKGKIWRVGLMGHGATARNVRVFLGALERVLLAQGFKLEPGAALQAAGAALAVG